MKSITVTVEITNDVEGDDESPLTANHLTLHREVEDDVPSDAVIQDLASRIARMVRTDETPGQTTKEAS